MNGAEAALFHSVYLYESLQLAIVRHRIGIHKVFGTISGINERTHIIAHHVAVEHLWISGKTLSCETVVVVPRFHVGDDVVLGLVLADGSHLLIVADHLAHLLFREAEHLIEAGIETHVQCDVVATGEIVERNGRDAKHDDAVEHRLEELEDVAVEADAVGELMISPLSLHVEHVVGEVVVFVDDEIELKSQFM